MNKRDWLRKEINLYKEGIMDQDGKKATKEEIKGIKEFLETTWHERKGEMQDG